MTPAEVALTIRCSADAALFARTLGLKPYEWQENYVRASSRGVRRIIANIHRRGGKDLIEAVASLHHCVFDSRACVVALSANERQASDWLRTLRVLYDQLPPFMKPALVVDNTTSLEFATRARVISLPCTETAPRGWGSTRLFLNEASRIPDEVYLAARPTIAATGGTIVVASTPNGPRGFFHDVWMSDARWERYLVRAEESPHLTAEFLEEERSSLGSRWFQQEYECQFTTSDDGIFAPELLDRAFAGGFPPLFDRKGTGTP